MEIALNSLAFIGAALCAGIMGFAIQRGGTCTVAAVDEVIDMRKADRLIALAEASLWVAGGLALASAMHWPLKMPAGYSVTLWTVLGGALLGFGAFINQACVFGAIARFGSGEWAYLATPAGFYAGCASVESTFMPAPAQLLAEVSPVLRGSGWIGWLFLVFVGWRVLKPALGVRTPARARQLAAKVWTPHAATTVIGIAFFFMLLLVGSWAYTETLADLARMHMSAGLAAKLVLLLALLGGAWWGGKTAGRFRSLRVGSAQLARCFTGGLLMGWGSLLIPGSNDGLILIGMPLLWPYAWLAFGTMCSTVAAALLVRKAMAPRLAAP